MPQPYSPTGQSAWIDLLRLLKQDEVSDIRDAPRLRKINGKAYWYDQYRNGDRIEDRYLAEDSADLRARIAQYKELHETQKERATAPERLMRILRAEDYLTPDLATGQIAHALVRVGVFRLGGTLVGTHAFRTYEGVLGMQIGFDQSAMTQDVDIASFERLSLALDDTVEQDLIEVFDELEFAPVPSLEQQ